MKTQTQTTLAKNVITSLTGVSNKTITKQCKTLEAGLVSSRQKAFAIAALIVAYGNDRKENHNDNNGFQTAGALVTACQANPALKKDIVAFFKGKIPHNFKNPVNGIIAVGKLDWTLVKPAETLAAETLAAKEKREVAAALTKAKRTAIAEKAAAFDALDKSAPVVSQDELKKAQLIADKNKESAKKSAQELKSALTEIAILKAELAKVKAENEQLRAGLQIAA